MATRRSRELSPVDQTILCGLADVMVRMRGSESRAKALDYALMLAPSPDLRAHLEAMRTAVSAEESLGKATEGLAKGGATERAAARALQWAIRNAEVCAKIPRS